jgi:hypothetical protein
MSIPLDVKRVVHRRNIYQQHNNWYVLDEDFTWNLDVLQEDVFSCIGKDFDIPVIFCDSCEANKIVSELGEEESEFLQFTSGVYWREVGIVFIFRYDEKLSLLETLFHELRHVMQEKIPELQPHLDSDKKLPYEHRITEKDAFDFAKRHIKKYILRHYTTIDCWRDFKYSGY